MTHQELFEQQKIIVVQEWGYKDLTSYYKELSNWNPESANEAEKKFLEKAAHYAIQAAREEAYEKGFNDGHADCIDSQSKEIL